MITGANRYERPSTNAPCHRCCHNPHAALEAKLPVSESLPLPTPWHLLPTPSCDWQCEQVSFRISEDH